MAGGRIWTARATGSGYAQSFQDGAYSSLLRLYVLVGSNEGVQTSPDGITWTARETPMGPTEDPKAIAWSEGMTPTPVFVMVGNGGLTYTSPDGVTWTQRQSAASHNLRDVAWDVTNSQFFAIDATQIQTSATGVDWTAPSAPTEFVENANTCMISPTVYVVGAQNGDIYTSTDQGSTWSLPAAGGGSTDDFDTSVWSAELDLYVLAGENGTVQTSPDAVTWTDQTTPITSTVNVITWSGTAGLFVAGTSQGEIMTSPDGVTWTTRMPDAGFTGFTAVTSGKDKFVLGGFGIIQTSEVLVIDPKHALNFRKLLPPGAAWGQD